MKNRTGSIAKYDPGNEPWRCCAQSKRSGERCMLPAVQGRRTCRLHGGTNPGRRPLTGRHSAVLHRLRETYERCLNDPSIIDMREPLAVLDMVVNKMLERVEQLDTDGFRMRALGLYEESREAIRDGNGAEGGALLEQLGALLRKGAAEDSALMKLLTSVNAQMNAIDRVWDKKLKRENVMSKDDVALLMLQVLSSVRKTSPAVAPAAFKPLS